MTFKLVRARHRIAYVFHVNLAQIRLAVPEIFHTQVTDSAKNRILRSSLRAACGNNSYMSKRYGVLYCIVFVSIIFRYSTAKKIGLSNILKSRCPVAAKQLYTRIPRFLGILRQVLA